MSLFDRGSVINGATQSNKFDREGVPVYFLLKLKELTQLDLKELKTSNPQKGLKPSFREEGSTDILDTR